MYCFCASYGPTEMPCGEDQGWCQDMDECVLDCDDACGSHSTSTTSAPLTSSSVLDCDALCVDQADLALSDGCCTEQFCQCTHGQESYLSVCYDGMVFCNAWEACVDPEICSDNQSHCCEDNLNGTTLLSSSTSNVPNTTFGSTTTDDAITSSTTTDNVTTGSSTGTYGSYCEELCTTNNVEDNGFIGDVCSDMYCFCASYGPTEMPCGEDQGWCQAMDECILDCDSSCGASTAPEPETTHLPLGYENETKFNNNI